MLAVRPLSAVVGDLRPFDIEPLVTCLVFEELRFLEMGLGVALFEDAGSSREPSLVLEVNLTTWRKINYLHMQTEGLGTADLLSACHIVCMT